jgi:hypothetical protein
MNSAVNGVGKEAGHATFNLGAYTRCGVGRFYRWPHPGMPTITRAPRQRRLRLCVKTQMMWTRN